MPVLRMNMSKSPGDTAPGQSGADIRVVENVRTVVVVNEIEVHGLEEDERESSGYSLAYFRKRSAILLPPPLSSSLAARGEGRLRGGSAFTKIGPTICERASRLRELVSEK